MFLRDLPNRRLAKHLVRRACHERPRTFAAIRDGKLYKADHATFEDYCKVRWGWTPQHAGYLISTSQTATRIEEISSTRPANAGQARPLTKLPADEQADAWEEVVADAEATGEKFPKKSGKGVDLRAPSGYHSTKPERRNVGMNKGTPCLTTQQTWAGSSGRTAKGWA